MTRILHILFLFLVIQQVTIAQFKLKANAINTGSNRCYRLTDDIDFQAGGIWSEDKINLNRPFDLLAKVNFGTKDNSGGDGMAFAFSQNNNFLDQSAGSAFGLLNLTPSIALEMDTYRSSDKSDGLFDHMSIQKNGDFKHGGANSLTPATNFGATLFNVEDGNDHTLRVTWTPKDTTLTIYFDCVQRIVLKYNIIKNIFGNNPLVYWGFGGACGVNNNEQNVCILRCSALDDYHEKTLCEGATPYELSASYGKSYAWSPSSGLSATGIRNPIANPLSTTTYIASVQHECNLTFRDTFKIIRPRLYPNTWTEQATLCEDKTITINATAPDAKTYAWSTGENTSSLVVKKTGNYVVTISDGLCIKVLDADITVNPLPFFYLGEDINKCENNPITLDATVADATYAWSTGENTPTIMPTKSGTYVATVTSSKGCKYKDVIDVTIRPVAKLEETKAICDGTFYTFQGKKYGVDTTLKATFVAANGCDSFYTVKINILPKRYGARTQRLCEGNEYDFFGQKIKKSGVYQKTLVAANGCDSIFTLTLNVINSDTSKTKEYVCKNTSYSIGNQTFNKDGVYSVKLKNAIGCDSFVILTLTVDKGLGYTFKDTICKGTTYAFDGKNLDKSGDYTQILKNQKGCDSLITLQLFVQEAAPVKLSATKKVFCAGEESTLTATGNYTDFLWNIAAVTSNETIVRETGTYRVSVTDNQGCVASDAIFIKKSEAMTLELVKKTPSCSGYSDGQIEVKNVIGGIAPYTYSFDGVSFSKTLIFKDLKEGNYTIRVKDSINCAAQSSEILANPVPKRIQVTNQNTSIELGDSTLVTIIPTFKDVAKITWQPLTKTVTTDLETWLKPTRTTRYNVIVADSAGCKFSDTVKVTVDTRLKLFMPTAFSANFDGINDDFRPFAGSSVAKILSFRVFDRWGNQVFEALDLKPSDTLGWDGTFRDTPLVQGVYLYHVKALKLDEEIEDVVGEVTLMR